MLLPCASRSPCPLGPSRLWPVHHEDPHMCHNPTGGAAPRPPLSAQPAPPARRPHGPAPAVATAKGQRPGVCPAPSASLLFSSLVLKERVVFSIPAASLPGGPPASPVGSLCLPVSSPRAGRARRGRGLSVGSFSAKRSWEGSAPRDSRVQARQGAACRQAAQVLRPGGDAVVETFGAGTPALRAFGANTSANPSVPAAAGEAAGRAGGLGRMPVPRACPPGPSARAGPVPAAWALHLEAGGPGPGGGEGQDKAAATHRPSRALGINGAPTSSSDPRRPLSRGAGYG